MTPDGRAYGIPEELLEREARKVSARYRVEFADARAALAEAFAARPDLVRRIGERHDAEDVTRWREYRDVVKSCRKALYYGLRRYYAEPDEADALVAELERAADEGRSADAADGLRRRLLAAHVSTRERLPHEEEFFRQLFSLCGKPGTVLDVGCGMQPLLYPFAGGGAGTVLYVAVDRDKRALRAAAAWERIAAPGRLVAARADLGVPGWMSALPDRGPYGLALMLKVVPVLGRLDAAAAEALGRAPAARLLVTGSVESMTRRERIEARERAALLRFLAASGRTVVAEFRAGNESGYLAE
jgi:16S rRNA (guanine(1405)-N(7))-methyltransferase